MDRAARALVALVVVLGSLTACGGDSESDTLTVLAAASLTGVFDELAQTFEAEHEGVDVQLSFGSSGTLARQAVDGAPGDVLATADEASMQVAADSDALDGDPALFATNTAVLVVPAGNPARISSAADLNDAGVDYVVCVDTAPCGKAAATLLPENGVTAEPASEEVDVKAVLAKVASGEADAGIVYVTDATAAGDAVETVELAGAEEARQTYPIAVLAQSENDLAQDWVDLVLSTEGQQLLADAGFGAAP